MSVREEITQTRFRNHTSDTALHFRFIFFALILCCVSPAGYAIGIGDLTMQSSLGEPLYAQVDLRLEPGEAIDTSCLSLSGDEDSGGFFPVGWIAALDQSGRKVEIRSYKPFNELFAIFRLKIKCRGMGSISKTLTMLPEFDVTAVSQATVIATHGNADEPSSVAAQNEAARISERHVATGIPHTFPFRKTAAATGTGNLQLVPDQEMSLHQSKATGKRESNRNKEHHTQFRLKLSGEPLDLSYIGKTNAEGLELLLARQMLLDEDDQAAQYLSVLHQMKLMQMELETLKLKLRLAELKKAASLDAASRAVVAPTQSTSENNPIWGSGLMLFGWLAAISLTWLGLRHVAQNRHRAPRPDTSTGEPPARPERQVSKPDAVVVPPARHEKNAQMTQVVGAPPKQADIRAEKESPASEDESEVLEEAELYAVYGHPDKGVKMLHQFVMQHPASEKAWMLLLSICSSRGQVKAFESAARNFLKHNKNSSSWPAIQALGRTLDQANPLYVDENIMGASAPLLPYFAYHKHRPIGDILVELNYLSPQDMEDSLKDFNPKRHGRFGNYLVMRKLVSYAQLGEALMKQQASGSELGTLPTLQQMEDLLKDFDPQRDGSVEEFLMSRKKSIAEYHAPPAKLELQEPYGQETAQPVGAQEPDKYCSMDFVLNFDQDTHVINKQSGYIAEDKSQPLEFDMELANHLARNNPKGI